MGMFKNGFMQHLKLPFKHFQVKIKWTGQMLELTHAQKKMHKPIFHVQPLAFLLEL